MAIEPDGPEINRMSNSPSTSGMGFDRARSSGWIVGDFSSKTSLLACPTPVSTGMHRFFFLFFCEGKEGNATCTVALLRLQQGSPVCLLPRWTICLAYPLKPSHAGEPGHIRLRKVDCRTRFKVEIAKPLIRREVRSSRCRVNLLPLSVKRVEFQLFLTRSEYAHPRKDSDTSRERSSDSSARMFLNVPWGAPWERRARTNLPSFNLSWIASIVELSVFGRTSQIA